MQVDTFLGGLFNLSGRTIRVSYVGRYFEGQEVLGVLAMKLHN